MDFFQTVGVGVLCGVFELPLLRNAQKRHLKKSKLNNNKSTHLPHL
jgi:hypothetical protein